MKSMLSCAMLSLFALALTACGVEGPVTDDAVQSKAAALKGDASTNAVIGLDCGEIHVAYTRATGSSGSESVARQRCGDQIRATRPTVRCPGCSIDGACDPLTRRSDIFYTCDYDEDEERWECSCQQRSFLGCYPCSNSLMSRAAFTEGCDR